MFVEERSPQRAALSSAARVAARHSAAIAVAITVSVSIAAAFLARPSLAATVITGHVTSAGGGDTTSATHSLRTTLGESVIARAVGTLHVVESGFWHDTPGGVTGIDDVSVPIPFAVGLPFPNPSSGHVGILLDLPRTEFVDAEIVGADGRRVAHVAHGQRPSGRHELEWNGVNAYGEPVGSGIYFLRIRTSTHRLERKITVLR
ncbi:MAG: T9SS type A sorting domain-containing protein [Candidatus Eisenbacteria bacterium]|uniref:T9SS type A sorting domain-containing protein n=1 Tax=Eiseniibacteriota bacterium TaxID=2212470 RepID=A0A956NCZ9_UNCEI|nr:T9SS type A sorting domain-containing protein [Candidatus Eisenbacteria bacterium]MCB9892764.1 T9SS type A sorting domain-containing protein [Planctomycetota bacterium]